MNSPSNSTQTKINSLLQRLSGRKDTPDPDESLFESGYLDSFALPEMVTALEQEFGFKIPDADLKPRTFDSVSRIETYIERHSA